MNKNNVLVDIIRTMADFTTIVSLSMFLFVAAIILYTVGSGDPRAYNMDFKVAFTFMACPLVLALISAGVRSLYDEAE